MIVTPEQINSYIAKAAIGGAGHLVPILSAVRDGRIAVEFLTSRDKAAPMGRLKRYSCPVLAVIGDDDHHNSGPAGWVCAQRVIRWARGVMIHGAVGTVASYKIAVSGAEHFGRFVLVETGSEHTTQWVAAAGAKAKLGIVCSDGPHPTTPAMEAMN